MPLQARKQKQRQACVAFVMFTVCMYTAVPSLIRLNPSPVHQSSPTIVYMPMASRVY